MGCFLKRDWEKILSLLVLEVFSVVWLGCTSSCSPHEPWEGAYKSRGGFFGLSLCVWERLVSFKVLKDGLLNQVAITEYTLAHTGGQPVCVPSPPLCSGGPRVGDGERTPGQSKRNPKRRTEDLLSLNVNW